MTEEFKLKIELVPKTSWYNNVRNEIPKRVWDKIRTDVCITQDYKCGICGAEGRLNCHEIWKYDDINYIQELKDFIALCNLCHYVKHIGHAIILASQGKLSMQEVEGHFMRVNECDVQTLRKHAVEAMIQYKERSKHKWELSLGKYEVQIRGSEEQKAQKANIIKELSELENLRLQIDTLETEKEDKINQILTPEIMEQIEEIKTEYSEKVKSINEQSSVLESKVRSYVIQYGATVNGKYLQAVWSKGTTRWDTKSIEEYSVSHPDILQFRKEGKPCVSIREIRQSKEHKDD